MSQKEQERRNFNLRKLNHRGTKENELDSVTDESGVMGVADAENPSQTVTSTAPRESGQRHVSGGSGRSRSTSPSAPPTTRELATMIGDMKETMVEMFARYSDKTNKKIDQVFNEVAAFKHEMEAVKEKVNTLEISVADTSQRIDDTSERIDNVKNKDLPALTGDINKVRADLEDKLLLYEIHDRKLNLLIYGAEKLPNENVYSMVHSVVADLLEITPEQAAATIPLVNAHRLPRKTNAESQRDRNDASPDPIIVRFARMFDRDRVLRAFERPPLQTDQRGAAAPTPEAPASRRRITIRSDLPPDMKRERGRLASVAYNLRKKEKLSTRILIHGTKIILQTRKRSQATGQVAPWSIWKEK